MRAFALQREAHEPTTSLVSDQAPILSNTDCRFSQLLKPKVVFAYVDNPFQAVVA